MGVTGAGACSGSGQGSPPGPTQWGGPAHVEGAGEVGAAVGHPLPPHLHAQRSPGPCPALQPHCCGQTLLPHLPSTPPPPAPLLPACLMHLISILL